MWASTLRSFSSGNVSLGREWQTMETFDGLPGDCFRTELLNTNRDHALWRFQWRGELGQTFPCWIAFLARCLRMFRCTASSIPTKLSIVEEVMSICRSIRSIPASILFVQCCRKVLEKPRIAHHDMCRDRRRRKRKQRRLQHRNQSIQYRRLWPWTVLRHQRRRKKTSLKRLKNPIHRNTITDMAMTVSVLAHPIRRILRKRMRVLYHVHWKHSYSFHATKFLWFRFCSIRELSRQTQISR